MSFNAIQIMKSFNDNFGVIGKKTEVENLFRKYVLSHTVEYKKKFRTSGQLTEFLGLDSVKELSSFLDKSEISTLVSNYVMKNNLSRFSDRNFFYLDSKLQQLLNSNEDKMSIYDFYRLLEVHYIPMVSVEPEQAFLLNPKTKEECDTYFKNNLDSAKSVIFDTQDFDTEEKYSQFTDLANYISDKYSTQILVSIRNEEQKTELCKYLNPSYHWPKDDPEWHFVNLD